MKPEKAQSGFDLGRHLRLMTYAFFMSGPIMHFVYSKILPVIGPGCSLSSVLKKVLFTQTLFNIAGTSLYFFMLTLMEGRPVEQCCDEVRLKLWPTVFTSWKIWPVMSFLNFYFIPQPF